MLIKRNGSDFEVVQNREVLFKSTDHNECVIWVNDNGGFDDQKRSIPKRNY